MPVKAVMEISKIDLLLHGEGVAALRLTGLRVRRSDSARFEPPNLREAVGEAVGEMCPYPAPAI